MRILQIGFDCHGTDALFGAGHQWAGIDLFGELGKETPVPYAAETTMFYADVETAFASFQPELVLMGINNLSKNPVELTREVIKKGVPLIISKLRLEKMSDYDALTQAASAGKAPVWIGEFYRLSATVAKARAMLNENAIGTPEQIVYQAFLPDPRIYPWMKMYPELALEDLAFHHFSVLDALTGLDGDIVHAYSRTPKKAYPATGSVCGASIDLVSGVHIEHSIHWINTVRETDFFGSLSLDGTEGGLLIENGTLYHRRWGDRLLPVDLATPAYVNVPAHAVDFLSGKTPAQPLTLMEFAPVMTALRASLRLAGRDRE